jgi:hypothetical protein
MQLLVLVLAIVVTSCDSKSTRTPSQSPSGAPADSDDRYRDQHSSMMPDNSPSNLLYNWLYPGTSYNGMQVISKDENAYRVLLNDVESFNCESYCLDDNLVHALIDARRLEWLRVGNRATGRDLTWISRLERLRGLSLQGADLTDGDLTLLAHCTHLQWLDLSFVRLPALNESQLPASSTLEFLSMANVQLSNDDSPIIPSYPRLRTLLLANTAVLDPAVQLLSTTSPHLRYLDLFGAAGVTDRSLPSLAELTELESLHLGKTGVEGTLARNAKALRKLEEHLPRCSIFLGD